MEGESYTNVYLPISLSRPTFEKEIRSTRFRNFFKSIVSECTDKGSKFYPKANFDIAIMRFADSFDVDETNAAGMLMMLIKSFYEQAERDKFFEENAK